MKKNMGAVDRIIRLLIAAAIAILFFNDVVSGTLGVILLVIAAIFLITGLISICPLYMIFGVKTCPAKKEKAAKN